MKKKSVVAGIAQKGGGKDGAVGYGHAGDNGEVRPSPKIPQLSFLTLPTFPCLSSTPPHINYHHQPAFCFACISYSYIDNMS